MSLLKFKPGVPGEKIANEPAVPVATAPAETTGRAYAQFPDWDLRPQGPFLKRAKTKP